MYWTTIPHTSLNPDGSENKYLNKIVPGVSNEYSDLMADPEPVFKEASRKITRPSNIFVDRFVPVRVQRAVLKASGSHNPYVVFGTVGNDYDIENFAPTINGLSRLPVIIR